MQIEFNVPLQSFNTFRLAARAARYARIASRADLLELRDSADWTQGARFVLGAGSNVLLTRDIDALVLHMVETGRRLIDEDESGWTVEAAAGENWNEFVEWTLAQGYPGLENLVRIPGTVGAAPIQNIGAYGLELSERVHSIEILDGESGMVRTLRGDECAFAYRDSAFKHAHRNSIVLSVALRLSKRWRPLLQYGDLQRALGGRSESVTPREVADTVAAIRARKLPDPGRIGNAGSFFKNPVVAGEHQARLLREFPTLVSYPQRDGRYKLAAAWLIDQCGWKGRALGRAAVHEDQALVLVNQGGASGSEVLELAHAIEESVRARFDVELEPELVVI